MDSRWFAPVIFTAMGMLPWLWLLPAGWQQLDGGGQFTVVVWPPIMFLLAGIAVREILRKPKMQCPCKR
jgi:hypothetical protein